MHLTYIRCKVADWIRLAQDMDQWRALADTVKFILRKASRSAVVGSTLKESRP
jgi:hypothetical protein